MAARGFPFLIIFLILASQCRAQVERYELGKRLKRTEIAWEKADSVHRAKAVSHMKEAVESFFSLQLRRAAAKLDDAYSAIRDDAPFSELQKFAISRRISVQPVIGDLKEPKLEIKIAKFYDAKWTLPANLRVRLELRQLDHSLVESETLEFSKESADLHWIPKSTLAGDFLVTATLASGAEEFPLLDTQVSRVADFATRLKALEKIEETLSPEVGETLRSSLRDWQDVISRLQKGEVLESDYPASRLLELGERVSRDSKKNSEIIFAAAKEADVWLTLAKDKQELPVRVRAPSKAEGPLPVLILFHGAGGSENMFFETYGAGRTVTLGIEQGWLVVAPRQGLLGLGMNCEQLLDCLSEIFPIDRKRVILLGHSMGAGQVIKQASLKPELFRAAVALGGGGRISKPEQMKSLPWFVAAGEFDFGKTGAASLARSLRAGGVSVTYKEYRDVEHMIIVQAALDDVFEFCEREMK